MTNVKYAVLDALEKMKYWWDRFWNLPVIRLIPMFVMWFYRQFHGEGSRGGHKRRLIAMWNVYAAMKLEIWKRAMMAFNTPHSFVPVFEAAFTIAALIVLIRIDRKRAFDGDDDHYGYISLIATFALLQANSAWLFLSQGSWTLLFTPGPLFLKATGRDLSFFVTKFPECYAWIIARFGAALS